MSLSFTCDRCGTDISAEGMSVEEGRFCSSRCREAPPAVPVLEGQESFDFEAVAQ